MPTNTETFTHTGSEQTFQVPSGVTTVTIEAWGAEGGLFVGPETAADSGNGGYATGELSVTPGETLYVYVGGQGADGTRGGTASGGFNGGGDGGHYRSN